MEKYKVCPYCGRHNPPKMLECVQCETDLSNVRVLDGTMEAKSKDDKNCKEENMVVTPRIRICDCGARNPVNARKCSKCGEDISDVIPVLDMQVEANEIHYVLASINGEFAYEIMEKKVVVGREAEMREYLSNKPYVSRNHAELSVENGNLYIVNLSKTNYTYVNNQKITQEKHEIKDGDEIGLGGNSQNGIRQKDAAYFQVRIGTCI